LTLGKTTTSQVSLEKLVQRWREKVYECLLTNKRYEFVIKDNLKTYNQDKEQTMKDLKEAQNQA
jgi:hypothetical protein